MKEFKYEVTVRIDETKIADKYPNYSTNYDEPEELADSIAFCAESAEDSMTEFGFIVDVEKKKDD